MTSARSESKMLSERGGAMAMTCMNALTRAYTFTIPYISKQSAKTENAVWCLLLSFYQAPGFEDGITLGRR